MTLPPFGIRPMRAVVGELPPADDDGWAYEVKWDGYRTLVFIEDGQVRLQSSNLIDVTKKWPALRGVGEGLNAGSGVVDGEVVALDETGRPSFGHLQRSEGSLIYVAFDLLHLDGHDLMPLGYDDRRHVLRDAFEPGPGWIVPEHHDDGDGLLEATREQGLEGVVAKRKNSPYLPGKRSPTWRKVKNRARQELVVGGWLPGEGNRFGTFASLLLGHHDVAGSGPLRYAGAVGTGFNGRTLAELTAKLAGLATATCPFDPPPPRLVAREARWVRPELVAEVEFSEWTADGIVRQSSFLGLRDDKDPLDVVRE